MFLNLLVNATRAIADVVGDWGGRGTTTLHTQAEGEHVQISVADTETNIPEATRRRIFDRFFTTKEVGRARGRVWRWRARWWRTIMAARRVSKPKPDTAQ